MPKKQAEPVVEEEKLKDPQEQLREECDKQRDIKRLNRILQKCNDRVNSKTRTDETCLEELSDYVQALDHCVAHKLFTKLK